MIWIGALALSLVTFLLAAHNTGAEPFVELKVFDAWVLGFAPGVVVTLWGFLGMLAIKRYFATRRRAWSAIALLWCAIGMSVTLSVSWMYFVDLSRNLDLPSRDRQ